MTALRLAVRVQNKAQAQAAFAKGASRVVLSGDVFLPGRPFTKMEICELADMKGEAELIIGLPHMMKDVHFTAYRYLMNEVGNITDGIFCTNLGAVKFFSGYKLYGDLPLNIYNAQAAEFYRGEGVLDFIASPELKLGELTGLLAETDICGAVIHGSPTVMYMEYDLWDGKPLTDSAGFNHPLYKDNNGRNHILPGKPLCLLTLLPQLREAGLSYGLIEAGMMTAEELSEVLEAYTSSGEEFMKANDMNRFTLGALNFK
jgi:putative protease